MAPTAPLDGRAKAECATEEDASEVALCWVCLQSTRGQAPAAGEAASNAASCMLRAQSSTAAPAHLLSRGGADTHSLFLCSPVRVHCEHAVCLITGYLVTLVMTIASTQ